MKDTDQQNDLSDQSSENKNRETIARKEETTGSIATNSKGPTSTTANQSESKTATPDSSKEKEIDTTIDDLTVGILQISVKDEDKTCTSMKIPAAPSTFNPIIHKVADWIRHSQRIIVVSGAGVSVNAGIPDFRTPGTGLYDNLQKYNLPFPEAVFDLDFFQRNPKPFVQLASELWPLHNNQIRFAPTLTHSFLALLATSHAQQPTPRLLRNYTQNIDGLEHLAGMPEEALVECHGHFRSATCVKCRTPAPSLQKVHHEMVQLKQVPKCQYCVGGYIKPDIVFFGEDLPQRFYELLEKDVRKADLCLVIGTSLQVAPVSMIPDRVSCQKRILINREAVGRFRNKSSKNHLFCPGDCDETIQQLAHVLGWQDELYKLNKKTKQRQKQQADD